MVALGLIYSGETLDCRVITYHHTCRDAALAVMEDNNDNNQRDNGGDDQQQQRASEPVDAVWPDYPEPVRFVNRGQTTSFQRMHGSGVCRCVCLGLSPSLSVYSRGHGCSRLCTDVNEYYHPTIYQPQAPTLARGH